MVVVHQGRKSGLVCFQAGLLALTAIKQAVIHVGRPLAQLQCLVSFRWFGSILSSYQGPAEQPRNAFTMATLNFCC